MNKVGKQESQSVAKNRLKLLLKGIAILLIILFALYITYSIYKYFLLKELEEKFKEYDNWTNYYAEIRTVEEARLIGKTEIWYRDNKYKIIIYNCFEDGRETKNKKWINCETNEIVEYNEINNEYIQYEQKKDYENIKGGSYIKKYFKWLQLINDDNILRTAFRFNIILKNKDIIQYNNSTIKMNENSIIPFSYTENLNYKISIRYYTINKDCVTEDDVQVKRTYR